MSRTTMFILLALGCLVVLLNWQPGVAEAQSGYDEVITAQVNVVTPGNHRVIGTIVSRRMLGQAVFSDWSFLGMINGESVNITGTAIERWIHDGLEEIDCTSMSSLPPSIERLREFSRMAQATIRVQQIGNGMVNVMGFPMSINTPTMMKPGSGSHNYILGNAGTGRKTINALPGAGSNTKVAPSGSTPSRLRDWFGRRGREE